MPDKYNGELLETEVTAQDNKVFISLDDLDNNCEYIVVVTTDVEDTEGNSLSQEYSYTFTSQYDPIYASFNNVMLDLQQYMSNINEDFVYRYIRENSQSIRTLTKRRDINWNNPPPYEVQQYVRFKTVYDIVLNAYVKSVGGSGKKTRLGDLDVDKKSASADMATIIKSLQDNLQPWYDMSLGIQNRGRAKSVSFVKGGRQGTYSDVYPFPRGIR